jgi:hypothetical protein
VSAQFQARLPEELHAELMERAARLRVPASELVRIALAHYMKRPQHELWCDLDDDCTCGVETGGRLERLAPPVVTLPKRGRPQPTSHPWKSTPWKIRKKAQP